MLLHIRYWLLTCSGSLNTTQALILTEDISSAEKQLTIRCTHALRSSKLKNLLAKNRVIALWDHPFGKKGVRPRAPKDKTFLCEVPKIQTGDSLQSFLVICCVFLIIFFTSEWLHVQLFWKLLRQNVVQWITLIRLRASTADNCRAMDVFVVYKL